MTIQEVAEKTGISAYTIRFYEKSGVLPHIRRAENGVRQFSEADVNRFWQCKWPGCNTNSAK